MYLIAVKVKREKFFEMTRSRVLYAHYYEKYWHNAEERVLSLQRNGINPKNISIFRFIPTASENVSYTVEEFFAKKPPE